MTSVSGTAAPAAARFPVARCAAGDVDPDWFFASRGTAELRAAKALCRSCPVRAACAAYAVDAEIPHGVFGGQDDHERAMKIRALHKRRAVS